MRVDAELCSGNIVVASSPSETRADLFLRQDNAASMLQWFHFRVNDIKSRSVELSIINAGEATYADAFHGYRAFASYDRKSWFRIDTDFDGQRLVMRHRPESDTVFYSYFAAYSLERLQSFLSFVDLSKRAHVLEIGKSVEGRPIHLIVIGEDSPGKRRLWFTGRQHPGETMSSWLLEGMVVQLLDESNTITNAMLHESVVYIVPNLNPDGSARGNFRTNVAGRDLNREWLFPSSDASPEVLAVRTIMERAGCDFFLDVHGDEHTEMAFAVGCDGNPGYSGRLYNLERRFSQRLGRLDESFDPEFDYGPDDPGKGDLRIANNWVGEHFDCLSLTLEMPFKPGPHPGGFGPTSASRLGNALLPCILCSIDALR